MTNSDDFVHELQRSVDELRDAAPEVNAAVQKLVDKVADNKIATDRKTLALEKKTRTMRYQVACMGVLLLFMVGIAFQIGVAFDHRIARNNRHFCQYVAINASDNPPPSTPRGAALKMAAGKLLGDLNCGDS